MKPRKPGRTFWIITFAVGITSPGTGKRRINSRMQELYKGIKSRDVKIEMLSDLNSELTSENSFLRRKLSEAVGERNMFLFQDEINSAVIDKDLQGVDTTMPLTVVN